MGKIKLGVIVGRFQPLHYVTSEIFYAKAFEAGNRGVHRGQLSSNEKRVLESCDSTESLETDV